MSQLRHAAGRGFHVPDGVYLLSHSVGCLPDTARDRLEWAFLARWEESASDAWPDWLRVIDRLRASLASLFGGDMGEWCPQPGVSAGVFRLLSALPPTDRKTLLLSRHAFPSIGYAMSGLDRLGYRLRLVDGDPTDIDRWAEAMSGDVAAAVFMHVHSNNGLVSPIAGLAALARSRGVFTIVDVCQSVGILPLSVEELGTDAVAGSCVKWLCGGPGAGFLWVRPSWIAHLSPPDRGWFSHAEPFEFRIDDFRYAPDALRFWGGTPSIAPFALAGAGIEAIESIGVPTIYAHNRRCLEALRELLPSALGERLTMEGRGGTLCLEAGNGAPALEARFRNAGCRVDRRDTVIRLSFHIFNTGSDVETVAGVLRDHPGQNGLRLAPAAH